MFGSNTHDEGLIKREHNNEFDGQELGEWPAAFQFTFREAVE
jgi:hypothetical protein